MFQQLRDPLRVAQIFSELANDLEVMFVVEPSSARSGVVSVSGWLRAGSAGGVGEGGDAELDGIAATGGDLVHLGELGAGAGEADFQSFGFTEPAVGLGLGDAGDEVVADLDQAGPGGGVWPQEWAA